jgi:hypothetical protein
LRFKKFPGRKAKIPICIGEGKGRKECMEKGSSTGKFIGAQSQYLAPPPVNL